MRGEDEARDMLEVIIVQHELAGQIAQQLGMRGLGDRPVVGGLNQTESHVALPNAVDDDLGEAAPGKGPESAWSIKSLNGHSGAIDSPGLSEIFTAGMRPPGTSGTVLVAG